MPNNYSRGKIYKIVCRKTDKQYIGSTTEPTLARRLAGHRCDIKRWKNGEFAFVSSFSVMEENDYYIELVELVPCSSKDELLVRERFHIQNNECVNKCVPLRTHKEWCEENRKQINEKAKEYYEENREVINEHTKIKYHEVPVEIRQIINHEKYEKNKEQIAERNKEKYDCPCGSTLRKSDKSRHEKSIKHQNYLKEILGENSE
jgi:hypothetical protein